MTSNDRGLGDTIARTTRAVGLRPCGGCKKRQDLLNRLIPYQPSAEETMKRAVEKIIEQMTPGSRGHVVAEARSWIGTPYHVGGRVKGAGCDCATLLLEVYRACGLILDDELGVFAGDWWMHTTEEHYLFRVARRAHKIAEGIATRSLQALPGAIVLCRTATSRVYNHGAVVTEWPRGVHAAQPTVQEVNLLAHPLWTARLTVIFDPWVRGNGRDL